ncbi:MULTISPECIES: glycosyltransferase family 2 protein [unclassified Kaistella]|uniref:glycosyltransferase family 2 protein n=1 Tax=unclassified Kaistella TaxID=2762626 RepID=UPI0027376AAC|nr:MULTISPECIES: glycosyltransferase family 2 protein [unclassified Kaistella]MDP2452525.1 glycosyltransferase family 2 protein [Kaistella sp. SH11-4b]MDP2455433.1 glycosyltransferase family 2 protein [Kaistella sp. SH40-3]MDP2458337.1 glycosyltransferase family 2 protein [Kaistella sp. SH19-2b]
MPTVTVIIPVYNAERYLHQCVNSILEQTFTDFQLLLINDGSSDKSPEICDEYATVDNRVTVFHQVNAGVSAARNVGLLHAKGKWITFVDSDDWISENYFDILSKFSDLDWIILSTDRVNRNKINKGLHFEENIYIQNSFLDEFTLYPHFPGPCGKFYRSEIIKGNKVQFNNKIHFGEDALFNICYLKFTQKIVTAANPRYYYRHRDCGLSSTENDYLSAKYLYEYLEEEMHYYPTKYYLKNMTYVFKRMLDGLYDAVHFDKNEKEREIREIIKKHFDLMITMSPNRSLRYLLKLGKCLGTYSAISKLLIYHSQK